MSLKHRVERLEKELSSVEKAKKTKVITWKGKIMEIRILKQPTASELGIGVTEQGQRVSVAPRRTLLDIFRPKRDFPSDAVFLRGEEPSIIEFIRDTSGEDTEES